MEQRTPQLEYSTTQPVMLDPVSRRAKGAKIAAIIEHFLGRADLAGLDVIDVGCSGGIVASVLRERGARVRGVDIDLPGLSAATELALPVAAGSCLVLPVRDRAADVVVCNHVYEHTVDPDAMMSEIGRVLRPGGIAYLGLGNRLGVMEPHHRLPFLSWLPRQLAHAYVRAMGRGDRYHEEFRTRRGLARMLTGWTVWDYTLSVLAEPSAFDADADVPRIGARLPHAALRGMSPLLPTYLWVATQVPDRRPAGADLRVRPHCVQSP